MCTVTQQIGAGGNRPWEHLESNLTEIRPIDFTDFGYHYFLGFVDTSGMGRTPPPQTETVPVVIKKLLQERIPRYRLLLALGPAL